MLFGLSRKAATEFSFFLAIPTLFAASAYSACEGPGAAGRRRPAGVRRRLRRCVRVRACCACAGCCATSRARLRAVRVVPHRVRRGDPAHRVHRLVVLSVATRRELNANGSAGVLRSHAIRLEGAHGPRHARTRPPVPQGSASSCARSATSTARWADADDGATHGRRQSRHRRAVGTVPSAARPRRAAPSRPPNARGRPGATCPPRTAARSCASGTTSCSRTADDLALILTTEQGKPLAEAKARDRDRRRVRRVVRRGRQARLRRRDPDHRQRPPPRRGQAAGRRVRRDHAVELPALDDHAQGRARRSPPAAPS